MLLQATLPGAPCVYYATRSGWRRARPRFPPLVPADEKAWERRPRVRPRVDRLAPATGRAGVAASFRVAASSAGAVAFERVLGEERVVVALDAGTAEVALDVELPGAAGCRLEPRPLPGVAAGRPPRSTRSHARVVLAALPVPCSARLTRRTPLAPGRARVAGYLATRGKPPACPAGSLGEQLARIVEHRGKSRGPSDALAPVAGRGSHPIAADDGRGAAQLTSLAPHRFGRPAR